MERCASLISGSEVVKLHRDLLGKELPEIGLKLFEPTGSWYEENKIKCCLEDRAEILSKIRIERDNLLSVAEWDPVSRKAILKKKKGKGSEVYGHHKNNNDYLYPEEALFLIETNSLILYLGEMHISVEVAYSLLLNKENGCTLDRYRVFSYLSRLGYKVIRHSPPSTPKKVSPPQKHCEETYEVLTFKIDKVSSIQSFDDIITIDDSSSDSSGEVVYLETSLNNVTDAIVVDDDSKDSVIILGETEVKMEILDLKEWPFVYWKKFLPEDSEEKDSSNEEESTTWIGLKQDLIQENDEDILKRIPNIKNKVNYLYRPDFRLLPQGVRPIHQKYFINLYRGRGFTPGRRGFRGFRGARNNHFGVRRSPDMRTVAMDMLKYASIILGGGVLPGGFNNQLFWQTGFSQRRFNYRNRMQRGGRRPFRPNWGRSYSHFEQKDASPLTVVISDDEEENSTDSKRGIKRISEDVVECDSKKIALESLSPSIKSESSSNSVKVEVNSDNIKGELNVDIKHEDDPKQNSLLKINSVKMETDSVIKEEGNEVKMENSDIDTESTNVEINDGKNNGNSFEGEGDKEPLIEENVTNTNGKYINENINVSMDIENCCIINLDDSNPEENIMNANETNQIESTDQTINKEQCSTEKLEDSNQDLGENVMDVDKANLIENTNKTNKEHSSIDTLTSSNQGNKVSSALDAEKSCNNSKETNPNNETNEDSEVNHNNKTNEEGGTVTNPTEETNGEGGTVTNPSEETNEEDNTETHNKFDEEDKMDEEFDCGQSIIQPYHCFSIENVFSTLQIFEGFDGDPDIDEKELMVVYDIYLPTAPFRKSSPDPPNFRLIIIGLDDPLPSANQMFKLKNCYQDRVQFLFAIVLKESIAFYVYDNISLPSEFK